LFLKSSFVLDRIQEEHFRIENFYEKTIPRYSPNDFQSHFRLTRDSVEKILHGLSGSENFRDNVRGTSGKENIPLLKALLVTLWTVGSAETYRSIGDRFNITKSSVCSSIELIRTGVIDVRKNKKKSEYSYVQNKYDFWLILGISECNQMAN